LVSRVCAIAVDTLLLTVAVLVVGGVPVLAAEAILGSSPAWLSAGSAALAATLSWLYYTACWWLTGETVGGMLLGLRVRRADGARLSPVRAGVRALVGLLFAPLWMVGLLGTLTNPSRRAWHDRLFGTVVNYVDRDAGRVKSG
jgi:uncharacterized RDD family membrane protein YckC